MDIRHSFSWKLYLFNNLGSGLCRYNTIDGSTLWYSEDSTAEYYVDEQNLNNVISINDNEILFGDRKPDNT